MPVVLADLRPAGRGQCVRLELILGLVAQPVGVLGVGGLELLLGELPREVVLAEGGDGDEVGAVPLAQLARLLPGVADGEKLVAVESVQFPLACRRQRVILEKSDSGEDAGDD